MAEEHGGSFGAAPTRGAGPRRVSDAKKLQPSPPPPTVPLLTYDESYKAVLPVNTDEEVQRALHNQAIEQGYNPATDMLAFAKL